MYRRPSRILSISSIRRKFSGRERRRRVNVPPCVACVPTCKYAYVSSLFCLCSRARAHGFVFLRNCDRAGTARGRRLNTVK